MKPNICTSILALFCAATTAQANLIINPGFETPVLHGFITVLSNFNSEPCPYQTSLAGI